MDQDDTTLTSKPCKDNLSKNIAQWALNHNIKHTALSVLLKILHDNVENCECPRDARTLLKTPKSLNTIQPITHISGGDFCYFSIACGIEQSLSKMPVQENMQIKFQLNVDGIPLFKSSNSQFWPILGLVTDPIRSTPFIIGLFYEMTKPKDLNFLNEFITEYENLKNNGIAIKNTIAKINLSAIVCDAPARAMIKNVKLNCGYYSCERCCQRGVYDGKMTFPELNATLRTDSSFEAKTDENHHTGSTPLSGHGLKLVSNVVLDYMHLVCLRVTRRLIFLWFSGPLPSRQEHHILSLISNQLIKMKLNTVLEFARKPRALNEFKRWN